ncbi:hypothetical protein GCM10007079_51060 [Nocardiopsis terrae]|nr:hypothetical protein GCM10007079_51060 [Nocardiopsis terrae]
MEIDGFRIDVEDVTARGGDDTGREDSTQVRDLHLDDRTRCARWIVTPKIADDLVNGDLTPHIYQEGSEDTTLAGSADRDRVTVGPDSDGTKHSEFHKQQH